MQRRAVFIVRIWIEGDRAGERGEELRGTLQPAAGGRTRAFSGLEQLIELLRASLLGAGATDRPE